MADSGRGGGGRGRARGGDRGRGGGDRGRGGGDRGRGGGDRGRGGGDRGRGGGDRGRGGGDRGRGGGDRGGGSFRGDRGGGGGGFRGDRGGGGGFRGDRGGGYGGDRGGRGGGFGGDRGGRGGGDRGRGGGVFRGGRGGARPIPFAGESAFFGQNSQIPQPDNAITQLEDKIVKDHQVKDVALVKKMSAMTISGADSGALMPRRPAYGTKGKHVLLWANYFRLAVRAKVIYRYNIEVRKGDKEEAEESDPKGKGKERGDGPAALIPLRKLKAIVKLALAELQKQEPNAFLATEFKSQLISTLKLNLAKNPFVVNFVPELSTREEPYSVKIVGETEVPLEAMAKYLQTMVDTSDPDESHFPRFETSLDALGVVLGFTSRQNESVTAIGKGRFFPWGRDGVSEPLGFQNKLSAIRGYFQSVRLGTGRVLLNVNVVHGVFKTPVLVSDLCRWAGVNVFGTGNPAAVASANAKLRSLSKFLARTRVTFQFKDSKNNLITTKKIMIGLAGKKEINDPGTSFARDFAWGGPREVSFRMKPEEGKNTVMGNKPPGSYTVAQYWTWKYGAQPDPTMPLVNIGTPARPRLVPAEECTIVAGQAVRSKLTGEETSMMLDFACRSPFANAVSLTSDSIRSLGLEEPILDKFGLTVDKKLLTVNGRELLAPPVTYANAKTLQTRGGSWNMNGVKVAKPGPRITSWNWVRIIEGSYQPRVTTDQVSDLVRQFVNFLNTSGIPIDTQVPNTPHEIKVARDNPDTAITQTFAAIDRWVKGQHGSSKNFFMLVVLPRQDTQLYGAVKTLADTVFGFHTVCTVEKTFLKNSPQTFANIGLKWNLKNGGVNQMVKDSIDIIQGGKTMVVGYDVTHPTNMPLDKNQNLPPSLVGLVASVDKDMGQWPAVAWAQAGRQEMLGEEFVEHFKSRLVLWRSRNAGSLPDYIVIYRDGVSEGQFTQVLTAELPSIREACAQLYPANRRPKISIIVSVKRHQTRFYPTSEQNMDERSRNIKNGTVVDRGVTQARYWDFFLTAHTALKGTARPAHYTVLLDEIFRDKYGVGAKAADQLEKLTHDLCYLFGRATKAVSICPPAYYADIVCDRARVHRPEIFDQEDTESQATGVSNISTARQVHENLKDTMYYI
ncbi:RNA interference and gene silencing protein [Colletotrichum plurivorum]|uniref:RNA interference and gene silencing protein n=1 Tax=Colletotrichum plurivorum TaxID=2175906 RepID=A0A8H6NPQ1_9PEZI|nr:RNA interference and gene silencing protein [Colletotrichum plurivorum]